MFIELVESAALFALSASKPVDVDVLSEVLRLKKLSFSLGVEDRGRCWSTGIFRWMLPAL